jgi:hypothetical protein
VVVFAAAENKSSQKQLTVLGDFTVPEIILKLGGTCSESLNVIMA